MLLHGFPDNLHTFHAQLPALAAAGYRAVAVAMRGYEPSSIPQDRDYSMGAVAGDIFAIMDALGAAQAHLVGHDWGAAAAYAAGAMQPQRFKSIMTMAVPHAGRFTNELFAHPKQLRLSWYMGFFQMRGLAEAAVRRRDFAFIRRLWRDWSPGWRFSDADIESVKETFRAPGVLEAALGYYRAAVTPKVLSSRYRAANAFKVRAPVMAITGSDDGCIDTEVFGAMMRAEDFPAGLRLDRIPGAGHFPHREQPEAVNALLLDWIAAHDQA